MPVTGNSPLWEEPGARKATGAHSVPGPGSPGNTEHQLSHLEASVLPFCQVKGGAHTPSESPEFILLFLKTGK